MRTKESADTLPVWTIKYDEPDPWIRDFVATKTANTAYVFDDRVKYKVTKDGYSEEYSKDIIKNNKNVSPYVQRNYTRPMQS